MARRAAALIALATLLACAAQPAAAQEGGGVALLRFADGSELPLSSWTFSYEYQAWKEGTSQAFSQPLKRESRELWSGKKMLPVAGAILEIQYKVYERQVEVDGQPMRGQGAAVTGFVLTAGGKKNEVKPDPPNKDLFLPAGGAKGLVVQPRALDIRGETLTGTKRDYCLVSYTPQVECSASPAERVVRIEFPR